jgi:Cu-Zn family superoxide dismutase
MRSDPEVMTTEHRMCRGIAVRGLFVGAIAAVLVAGCESTKDPAALKAAKAEVTVAEARFLPIGGSSLTGAAMLGAYDGGVQMRVNFNGRGPGRYRVMIHATGNCSSPNGFSAGPPWAPPGVPLAEEGFPILKNDDSASYVVRLTGYRLTGPDGVVGRSVVVHEGGAGTIVAKPDVPNDRIGCGVIGPPTRTLLDFFKD